ncbi:MAG: isochorismatase family protein [Planctomycetes bacterium]|nr:isochorismatase family protein [Planctomycetota bacterium]
MPSFDIHPANSALVLIDMQERFLPVIPAMAADQGCGRNCRILLEVASLLGIPTTITEQYPKGLGTTLPYLVQANATATLLEKMHFSCADDAPLRAHLEGLGRRLVVLCGVETHVCVLHTAADLLARGTQVIVAADAVASRKDLHRDLALTALRDLGALLVPTESIAMRWQRVAGTPAFKAISGLIK